MIIFLYGPDSYRSKQKLDEIISHYKESGKSGLNLISVDAKENAFPDFYDTLRVSSMFAEKKLVIIKNVFAGKGFQEELLEEIKNIENLKDVVVVYETEAPDQRLKIFKTLVKTCKCQEFALLEGSALKQWAQKEFERLGQKSNLDAADLLVQYVGNDLWRLAAEIKKLGNFKNGATIKKEDVLLMVKPRLEVDIFKTIDAMAAKNRPQALSLVKKHLDNGEAPLYILSMIAYQYKNLLVVKELAQKGFMYASIVKKSGLHPFVVKKTYFASSQFSLEELKIAYHNIFQMDLDIKTGKIDQEAALELLVSSI